MARDGFLILDSDLHMMEPDDLWARYLEGPHRASLPRFSGGQQQKLSDSPEDKGHANTIMRAAAPEPRAAPTLPGRARARLRPGVDPDRHGYRTKSRRSMSST